jgi:hypothetical protein
MMAGDRERFNVFFHAMLDEGVYFAPAAFEAGFVSSQHTDGVIDETSPPRGACSPSCNPGPQPVPFCGRRKHAIACQPPQMAGRGVSCCAKADSSSLQVVSIGL